MLSDKSISAKLFIGKTCCFLTSVDVNYFDFAFSETRHSYSFVMIRYVMDLASLKL